MVHDEWAIASARDGIEAMNRRDWSSLDSVCAVNVIYESPSSHASIGRDAMRRRYEDLVAAVPDLRGTDLRMIQNDPAGNWATFAFRQTGTLPATGMPERAAPRGGSPFVVHTTMLLRFDDDGRVVKMHTAHA